MNQRLVLVGAVMCGVLLFLGYTARSQKVTHQQDINGKYAAGVYKASNWKAVPKARLKTTYRGLKLPKAYQVYQLDAVAIRRFFVSFNRKPDQIQQFNIPLPESIGVQSFAVKDAKVLSEPLRKKYPNLYNLSGNTTNMLSHIRLNYDGTYMTAMITIQNKTFLLTPWEAVNGTIYYLLYNKNNTNETKHPFEHGEIQR